MANNTGLILIGLGLVGGALLLSNSNLLGEAGRLIKDKIERKTDVPIDPTGPEYSEPGVVGLYQGADVTPASPKQCDNCLQQGCTSTICKNLKCCNSLLCSYSCPQRGCRDRICKTNCASECKAAGFRSAAGFSYVNPIDYYGYNRIAVSS